MSYKLKDPITKEEISYYMEGRLIFLLDYVKNLIQKKDKDYVMIIDGYEGAGKSTLAAQCGKYVDPSLNLSRICMTPDEFKQSIINANKGQCVIYDEAVTGMTSGESIAKVGRILKSLMMQMRQKNLFVIVLIPTLFELNKYATLSRARFMLHVYESHGRMGYFVGLNKKAVRMTYLKGKRTHSYSIKSKFTGRFYGKFALGEKTEILYRKKKQLALEESSEDEEAGGTSRRWEIQRDWLLWTFKGQGLTLDDLVDIMSKAKFRLSHSQIGRIIQKMRTVMEKQENIPDPRPIISNNNSFKKEIF
ncbi:hypothetical protein LCGC14_0571130 [marine sediment metagenome]|uniref:Zona occludens toxin N-terminal domain-containing protein n=1 Tax=marine sediment metagenome TaxID=412755 RepID=A0A0F9RJ53_9ZZZZ